MVLIIILCIYLFAILCDFRSIAMKKSKKVIIIYSVILTVTFSLMVIDSFGIEIPSPSVTIRNIIISFTKG